MPAVGYENISCGSPPYRLNPVPPNEKQSCLNQYRARVVSWDPPSSQSTQLNSSCGGPSHYVGIRSVSPRVAFIRNLPYRSAMAVTCWPTSSHLPPCLTKNRVKRLGVFETAPLYSKVVWLIPVSTAASP